MATSKHAIEDAPVTEATPLSPPSPLLLHHHEMPTIANKHYYASDNKLQLKSPRHIIVASIVIVSSIIALVILVRGHNHYYSSISSIHTIAEDHDIQMTIPSERRDVVENYKPERRTIKMPAPPLYLSNRQASPLLGRRQRHNDEVFSSIRWGILGPGRIAHDFTSTLIVSGCNVTAVAASHNYTTTETMHSSARAKKFAKLFSISNYYDNYQELASDPNVDIVYVATTNDKHMEPTLMMLRGGKNVLVEKPTAITFEETKRMYDEAKQRGLFLMTNHWTRFFPLIKHLRRTYLAPTRTNALVGPLRSSPFASSKTKQKISDSTTSTTDARPEIIETHPDLGKVLAMEGDFSFPTPVNPSDRYLNRTLGGGVTLDVGCYLVELALLAAYDHRRSHQSLNGNHHPDLKNLRPDGIAATGHGLYHGVSFPVDVESSFSLRWGGGPDGIIADCEEDLNADVRRCEMTGTDDAKSLPQNKIQSTIDASGDGGDFTMIGSFQASFRRPSAFEVEYTFEKGRILIHGPGNCPSEMTIYQHEDPFGPLIRETKVTFPLPQIKVALLQYGKPNYPRSEGFVYVIDAIEKCMAEKGVPGKTKDLPVGAGCLELEENTIEEQLVTVEVTKEILKKMGYFGR
ncbi:hypothetical protein ACHAXR_013580 [Thalassiosira sp. AJA248-18]